jgi:predicted chitinase
MEKEMARFLVQWAHEQSGYLRLEFIHKFRSINYHSSRPIWLKLLLNTQPATNRSQCFCSVLFPKEIVA